MHCGVPEEERDVFSEKTSSLECRAALQVIYSPVGWAVLLAAWPVRGSQVAHQGCSLGHIRAY